MGAPKKLEADVSAETLKVKRERQDILMVLKGETNKQNLPAKKNLPGKAVLQ